MKKEETELCLPKFFPRTTKEVNLIKLKIHNSVKKLVKIFSIVLLMRVKKK
jgi:hypothetical protein